MGHKILTSAAIAAAIAGAVATPAFANGTRPSLSNGVKLTAKQRSLVNSRMRMVESRSTNTMTGQATRLQTGTHEECTVPQGHHGYVNFVTTDTIKYFEADSGAADRGLLVATCTADLKHEQHSATATGEGPLTHIPFPKTTTVYSEACTIPFGPGNLHFIGDAESVVYPDGEFDETCIVPVIIS
jgi:hypothetical protein